MSGFMYGMFVFSGLATMTAVTTCPLDIYGFASILVGALCAVTYLRLGDEARYF